MTEIGLLMVSQPFLVIISLKCVFAYYSQLQIKRKSYDSQKGGNTIKHKILSVNYYFVKFWWQLDENLQDRSSENLHILKKVHVQTTKCSQVHCSHSTKFIRFTVITRIPGNYFEKVRSHVKSRDFPLANQNIRIFAISSKSWQNKFSIQCGRVFHNFVENIKSRSVRITHAGSWGRG